MSDDVCPICQQAECDHSPEEQGEAQRRVDQKLPPLVLSGDETQQRKTAQLAKKGENQADDDLRQLMADVRFRRFIWNMMNVCGLHRCEAPMAEDGIRAALQMSWAQGERNIGNFYYAAIERVAVADVAKMIAENGGTI